MFLKQERPEMDDFERIKHFKTLQRKNIPKRSELLTNTIAKIFLHPRPLRMQVFFTCSLIFSHQAF